MITKNKKINAKQPAMVQIPLSAKG